MKILKHPLFISVCLVALAIYFAKMYCVALPNWMRFYLNDLLCMPIVLSLCLATVRILKKDDTLFIPLWSAIGLTVCYVVYFEWFLPQYNSRYTADIIDVALYVMGSGLFYRFQKKIYR